MSRFDYASRIVSEFCAETGLLTTGLDASGCLSLEFDDITVTLQHVTWPMELLTVLIDLGPTPDAGVQGLAALLELNLGTWGRGNMTVGLTADKRQVLGRNAIPVSRLDAAALHATVVPMLSVATEIRVGLQELDRSAPSADVDTDPDRSMPPPGFHRLRV